MVIRISKDTHDGKSGWFVTDGGIVAGKDKVLDTKQEAISYARKISDSNERIVIGTRLSTKEVIREGKNGGGGGGLFGL